MDEQAEEKKGKGSKVEKGERIPAMQWADAVPVKWFTVGINNGATLRD